MLDAGHHQAISLQRSAAQAGLRILSVVNHGAQDTDQAVMWDLCAALHQHGYPVAVLDGGAPETPDNPGLADLLHDAMWDDGALPPDAQSMSVIPAARGLRQLRSGARLSVSPLHRMQGLFRMYRAVIVYADASTLAPLVEDTQAEPVIFLPPLPEAVVSAYNGFKQLKMQSGVSATVVAVMSGADTPQRRDQADRVQATLRSCAITHMGCAPRARTVGLDNPQDVPRLALQLLENAINIGASSMMPAIEAPSPADSRHEARSH